MEDDCRWEYILALYFKEKMMGYMPKMIARWQIQELERSFYLGGYRRCSIQDVLQLLAEHSKLNTYCELATLCNDICLLLYIYVYVQVLCLPYIYYETWRRKHII